MSEDKQRIFGNIGKGTIDYKTKLITWVKDKMKKGGMFTLFLVAINGFYLIFGGLIFMGFERIPPVKYNSVTQISAFLQVLKDTQVGQRIFPEGLSGRQIVDNMTSQDLNDMSSKLDTIFDERSAAGAEEWTIYNSVFFASTVVTTIGYGSLSPSTAGGRVFCVIYALLGIPLTLMLLALVGRYLAEHINNLCGLALRWFTHYVHPEYQYESPEQEQSDDKKIDAPIWLALLFLVLFTSIMAGIYSLMEGWDFGTSLYFLFISYTTIGFGDVVPHDQMLVILDIILMYIGLAVVSITINLCMVNIQHQMMKAKFIEEMQANETEMNETGATNPTQGDNPFKPPASDTEETAVKEQLSSEDKRTYGSTGN